MVVDVRTAPTFEAGTPRALFDNELWVADREGIPNYDVSPDGGFVIVRSDRPPVAENQLHVVLDWFDDLRSAWP